MNYDNNYSMFRQLPGAVVADNVGLLNGKDPPGMEMPPYYRGRHSRGNSRDERLRSIDETDTMQYDGFEMVDPPTSPSKTRRLSSGSPSTASSMLRRLTTKISPMNRAHFHSTKGSQGQRYATLGDGGYTDSAVVDISSLEGLGWEMTDMSNPDTRHLHDDQTEYFSPAGGISGKPDFRSFVNKRHTLGEGMRDIGVQLRRDPTKLVRRSTGEPINGQSSGVDRSRTVRELGQSLAQERNIIVEVEEAVDLSSLEGGQRGNRANQTFETMPMRHSVMPQETKSYFFPEDPDIPNWRPLSMRSAYILSLMALALGLAGFQEFLCQRSLKLAKKNSGILEFNQVADISTWDFFAWKCQFQ